LSESTAKTGTTGDVVNASRSNRRIAAILSDFRQRG
jgi:hypothetical protein